MKGLKNRLSKIVEEHRLHRKEYKEMRNFDKDDRVDESRKGYNNNERLLVFIIFAVALIVIMIAKISISYLDRKSQPDDGVKGVTTVEDEVKDTEDEEENLEDDNKEPEVVNEVNDLIDITAAILRAEELINEDKERIENIKYSSYDEYLTKEFPDAYYMTEAGIAAAYADDEELVEKEEDVMPDWVYEVKDVDWYYVTDDGEELWWNNTDFLTAYEQNMLDYYMNKVYPNIHGRDISEDERDIEKYAEIYRGIYSAFENKSNDSEVEEKTSVNYDNILSRSEWEEQNDRTKKYSKAFGTNFELLEVDGKYYVSRKYLMNLGYSRDDKVELNAYGHVFEVYI